MSIFEKDLLHAFEEGENVIADTGYKHSRSICKILGITKCTSLCSKHKILNRHLK